MAAKKKVPVCVDGPHAIMMLDLNLNDLGCDYYCASGHKWLCGPFGSGFLWVHPRRQHELQTPIVSWGGSIAGRPASWKDRFQLLGTRVPAPLLAMADAVNFFTPERISEYRAYSHELIRDARRQLLEIPGTGAFCTPDDKDFVSMAHRHGAEVIFSNVQPQPAQVLRRNELGPRSGKVRFAPDHAAALEMASAERTEPT